MFTCKQCGKSFSRNNYKKKPKYCSQECYHNSRTVEKVKTSCENCGKEYKIREKELDRGRGRFCSKKCKRIHKKVILKCEVCGDDFIVSPSRADKAKYCGQECYHKSREKPKVDVECKNCGEEFEVTENDYELGKGQFCQRSCRGEWRTKQRKKRNAKKCEVCGDEFYPKPSLVEYGVKRCSVGCKAKAYLGKGHPLWSPTGRRVETNGYVTIRLESGEWVPEHRYVVENIIGRTLDSREEIHHIDHDRSNNDLNNLSIIEKTDHLILHHLENLQKRFSKDPEFVENAQKKIDAITAYGQKEIYEAIEEVP